MVASAPEELTITGAFAVNGVVEATPPPEPPEGGAAATQLLPFEVKSHVEVTVVAARSPGIVIREQLTEPLTLMI
jgi:hypothetical protein